MISEDEDLYSTELLECVLYEMERHGAFVVHLPTSKELSPDEFYMMVKESNPLFWYKYYVYCCLKEKGW